MDIHAIVDVDSFVEQEGQGVLRLAVQIAADLHEKCSLTLPWLEGVETIRARMPPGWYKAQGPEPVSMLAGLYEALGQLRACESAIMYMPRSVLVRYEEVDGISSAEVMQKISEADLRLWAFEERGGAEWQHRLSMEAEHMLDELRIALDWCEADPANRPFNHVDESPKGFSNGECDFFWLFWRRTHLSLLTLGINAATSDNEEMERLGEVARLREVMLHRLILGIAKEDHRLKAALKGNRAEGRTWMRSGQWWLTDRS